MRLFATFILFTYSCFASAQSVAQLDKRFPVDETLKPICQSIELPSIMTASGNHLSAFEKEKIQIYLDYFLIKNPEGLKQAIYRQVALLKYRDNPMLALLGISISGFKGNYYNISFPVAAKYSVTMTEYVDTRMDFTTNYTCATKWMKQQSTVFPLPEEVVLAFINSPGALKRSFSRSNSKSINDIYNYLPEETRNTYFIYLALNDIYSKTNYKQDDLRKHYAERQKKIKSIAVQKMFHFNVYEMISGENSTVLKQLNPTLVSDIVPAAFTLKYTHPKVSKILDSVFFYQDSILNNPNYNASKEDTANITLTQIYYTVKKGDNLNMISAWFDIDVKKIQVWNSISGDRIEAGQVLSLWVNEEYAEDMGKISFLSLPTKNELLEHTSFVEVLKDFEYYTVKKGDSLWSISKGYRNVSADDIMKWNGISPAIEVGQKIVIKTN